MDNAMLSPQAVYDLLLVIVAGLLGGIGTNIMNVPPEGTARPPLLHDMVLGVVAAFTVPLFLYFAHSAMLPDDGSTHALGGIVVDAANRWVFFSMCLLAAVFSRRFLTTLGDKLLERVKNAETQAKTAKEEAETAKQDAQTAKEDAKASKDDAKDAKKEAADAKTKSEEADKQATAAKAELAKTRLQLNDTNTALEAVMQQTATMVVSARPEQKFNFAPTFKSTDLDGFLTKNGIRIIDHGTLRSIAEADLQGIDLDSAFEQLKNSDSYSTVNLGGKEYVLRNKRED